MTYVCYFQMEESSSIKGSPLQPISGLQVQIFDYLSHHTWEQTICRFHLSSKNQVESIAVRTAHGFWWDHGCTGGQLPFLSCKYEIRLADLIEESAGSNNAVRTCDVAELASRLHKEMQERAVHSLLQRECSVLAASIHPYQEMPSSQWVRDFCRRHKLNIDDMRSIDGTAACLVRQHV